jgi:lysophospholipase L1-like esterase
MAWTREDQAKAVDVVLNKVDGVWFAYYAVDLSAEEPPFAESDARAVLDAIESHDGRYRWNGTDAQRVALLPTLTRVFREHPEIAAEAFRRIFDMNEIPADSGAGSGFIGELNRGERRARLDQYLDAVRKGKCRDRTILVAEGDSWFQFPGKWVRLFGLRWVHFDAVKDVLDHLMALNKYCVHSLAAGGDWLFEMLRAKDYVEPLSQIEPDAFLLSGGGNDLLGDGRVGNMTLHQRRHDPASTRHKEILDARVAAVARRRDVVFDREKYARGVYFLAKEFVSFLNLALVQYVVFFSDLRRSKLSEMRVVTHGYDFAIPSERSTARLISIRRLVNKVMGSGKWLWIPLEQKRLADDEKRAVLYAMITEFNELLVSLAESPRFPRLYHVDCRGIAQSEKDWYDEIHLTSKAYRRAAALFEACIAAKEAGKKVFTVADLR